MSSSLPALSLSLDRHNTYAKPSFATKSLQLDPAKIVLVPGMGGKNHQHSVKFELCAIMTVY